MKTAGILVGIISFSALAGTTAWAGSVTIPNTFVADTKAVAADVNANFNAVKTAVDDNDARITTNTNAIATKADADDVTAALAEKLDTADLGSELDTATTTAGNSIDGNKALIDGNTTAINNKLDTADLGSELDTATTTAGNSIDGNADAITDLQQNASKVGVACAGNDANDIMVRVGPLCVDVYEASLWDSATGGNAINADTCADNGNDCSADGTKIYARSVAGVTPDANITWFAAQQACANSGKRLLTNAEWQMAAAGTPDPGATPDTANNCNTDSGAIVATGASSAGTSACVSNWGTFDMIGNLNEWTADWIHGANDGTNWNTSTGTAGADYGADTMNGTNPAALQGTNSQNFPGAIYRGGAFSGGTGAGVFSLVSNVAPSYKGANIGFRCAR